MVGVDQASVRNATPLRTFTLAIDCFNIHSRLSNTEAVSRHITLSNVNEEHRDSGGRCWVDATPAELSGSADQSYVPSLVKFGNIVGFVLKGRSWVWDVRRFDSPADIVRECAAMVSECVDDGSLWTLPNARLAER